MSRETFEKWCEADGIHPNSIGGDVAWEGWKAGEKHGREKALEEIAALRAVYECARSFLRFNGVDKERVDKAVDNLDNAIEHVKLLDSGYEEE